VVEVISMPGGAAGKVLTIVPVLCMLGTGSAAQSVIAARSGVIHFFEGTVYLGDQLLERQLGRFPMLPDGGELRTEQGRAEVLLTPGVFLRMGENSAVRLLTSDLEDTQVELITGSAAIDCTHTAPGYSLTVGFQQWHANFLKRGLYRIDSAPASLSVRTGMAEVRAGNQAAVTVERGMRLPLEAVLVPEPVSQEADDSLAEWSIGRRQSIAADDAISSQIDEGPASTGDPGPGIPGVSQFPLLGLSSVDPSYGGVYGGYSPYQVGFNSIYLPGYYYRPMIFLGFGGAGYRTGLYTSPYPSGLYGSAQPGQLPGLRMHIPHAPPVHTAPVRPGIAPPLSHPSAPHSSIGHVGGHGR
jgi:hypothetical protein